MMFPVIDEKKTVANVQAFFSSILPRLLNRAGRAIDELTKPAEWEKHYRGQTKGNEYEQIVDAIIEAIGIMRDGQAYNFHRTLLIDCYIKRKTNFDEEIKLGYGERTINKYRLQACVEFAECLEGVKDRRGIEDINLLAETVQEGCGV